MLYGLEVDMLDLGDADCIVVTQWAGTCACRVLIDGGSGGGAQLVSEFLHRRDFRALYAVVCTHPHNDHAKGLIKLAQDKSISIASAWMHDIRKHVGPDALRRASAGNTAQAEGVRQVVETTAELARAFSSRNIPIQEPFAGRVVSYVPSLMVLGPEELFYKSTLEEFTKVEVPIPLPLPSFSPAASILGGKLSIPTYGLPRPVAPTSLFRLPLPPPAPDISTLLGGALSKSSVKENPKTQPFNNTSVILGCSFDGHRLLFTADAGAEALDRISTEWKNLAWLQVPHHGSDGNLSQSNIERFCPKFAYISAKGDTSHPSRAIVNGLIKVGAQVASTHMNRNLWFRIGNAPPPPGYGPLALLKGNAPAIFG